MSESSDDGSADEVAAFWTDARVRARLNRLEGYLGENVEDTLPPPTWSFGDDRRTADELLGLVLSGRKTATASARRDYEEDDDLPRAGLLAILLDGAGHPRALIRTTEVEVVRFADVPAGHAHLEGEGDRSLEHWRRVHREFFTPTSPAGDDVDEVDDDTLVVLERFEVLVPTGVRRAARRVDR